MIAEWTKVEVKKSSTI